MAVVMALNFDESFFDTIRATSVEKTHNHKGLWPVLANGAVMSSNVHLGRKPLVITTGQ
jgi:hypothetical protein